MDPGFVHGLFNAAAFFAQESMGLARRTGPASLMPLPASLMPLPANPRPADQSSRWQRSAPR